MNRSFTSSRSLTYNYYIYRPQYRSTLPTLVLLHGWPDDSLVWSQIVPYLLPYHFPVLIPDLLGHGRSSKPTDPAYYNFRDLMTDLTELFDAECLGGVVPIGHDIGAILASRLYNYFAYRCVGLITLNSSYRPPQEAPFDLESYHQDAESSLGYPIHAYWDLLTASDGADVLNTSIESLFTALHSSSAPRDGSGKSTQDLMCTRGALRAFLYANTIAPVQPYAQDPQYHHRFLSHFARHGFESSLCYFRAFTEHINYTTECQVLEAQKVLNVPYLSVTGHSDPICPAGNLKEVQDYLTDVSVIEVESGHWSLLASPRETGECLVRWLVEKYYQWGSNSSEAYRR
jgi:soluble epoxide hydrolase / lipid-phosphate phosphatase